MAGEMGWAELVRGNGEGWVLHHAIADYIGGTVYPFDQYQGPQIVDRVGVTLWVQGEDGLVFVYNERTERRSNPFPMYRNGELNTEDAIMAALAVYTFPTGDEVFYTRCLHCDHFVTSDTDGEPRDDADEHLYDGDQEFDHDPVRGYERRTLAAWKAMRPDLFVEYRLADRSKATGPNAFLYKTRDDKGRDLPSPIKRLRAGKHDTVFE